MSAPSPCDKQLINVVAVIVLVCVSTAGILAWHHETAIIAAFLTIAGQAISILSPSPLKGHSTASADAGPGGTINQIVPAAPASTEEPVP